MGNSAKRNVLRLIVICQDTVALYAWDYASKGEYCKS